MLRRDCLGILFRLFILFIDITDEVVNDFDFLNFLVVDSLSLIYKKLINESSKYFTIQFLYVGIFFYQLNKWLNVNELFIGNIDCCFKIINSFSKWSFLSFISVNFLNLTFDIFLQHYPNIDGWWCWFNFILIIIRWS